MRKDLFILFLLSLFLISGCTSSEVKLAGPSARLFIDTVQLIISNDEKDLYFSLSDEERREFEVVFWKLRDPHPDTEINEFKEEYLKRIETARRLFRSDGKGQFKDRARVYILIGPPDETVREPMTNSSAIKGYEIWIYRQLRMRVNFIDRSGFGNYELYRPDTVLSHYLSIIQKNLIVPGRNIKPIEFTVKRVEDGFTVKIRASSLSFSEENNKMIARLRIKFYTLKKEIFRQVVQGTVNKDSQAIPEFLEFKLTDPALMKKYDYMFFNIKDLTGMALGGRLIKGDK